MTTTKTYDNLNRLMQISSAPSASSVVSFNYLCNSANQRTLRTDADGSRWRYGYDSLGQVTVGKKYWADWTPVAGEQYEYAFDDIGNRTSTKVGGDETGSNLRSANYHANSLNQYTNRDVPGYLNILGLAYTTNAVTVNGQSTYRKGEFFRKELPVNNSSAPQWTNITVAASGQTSVTGHEFLPKTAEAFSYDLDGNLISDGRWRYTWDAENRLVGMTTNTTVGPQISLAFEYDSKGRRIRKQVWDNPYWSGSPTNDNQFLYDGWNLVSEFRTPQSAFRTYLWGLDLSGSPQGAGGVGGLLAESQISSSQVTNSCFIAFDGNGNASALVNATNGALAAQCEYGPFGEVIRKTGLMADAMPFRFSTKYQDDETDDPYYGYRYYNSITGIWLSRDPSGELAFVTIGSWNGTDGSAHAGHTPQHADRQADTADPGDNWERAPSGRSGLAAPTDTWNQYSFVANRPAGASDFLGLCQVTDDANRSCSSDEMQHVELRIEPEFFIGHAFLKTTYLTRGFYPSPGVRDIAWFNDEVNRGITGNDSRHPYSRVRTYFACPVTMFLLEWDMVDHGHDPCGLSNARARNCAGWALERLQHVGFTVPFPPNKRHLRPKDL